MGFIFGADSVCLFTHQCCLNWTIYKILISWNICYLHVSIQEGHLLVLAVHLPNLLLPWPTYNLMGGLEVNSFVQEAGLLYHKVFRYYARFPHKIFFDHLFLLFSFFAVHHSIPFFFSSYLFSFNLWKYHVMPFIYLPMVFCILLLPSLDKILSDLVMLVGS